MKTYQLKFLAWTFSAFLPPDDPDAEKEVDYYDLLDVTRAANGDDIKKAYRKRSLQLHPDKLRQRGMRYQGEVITEEEARSRFQQMKAAYDTLSDPKKREIYDALGHRGMEFVINPSRAWDPHILLGNLAKSSVFDRAKLMALVLVFFGLVLLQPILVCAKVDQMLEENGGALENSSWVVLLLPFWFFAAFYGLLLIIGKAALPLLQWISFVVGILFLTLRFDKVLIWDYAALFIPFYLWICLRLFEAKKEMGAVQAEMSKMATIEYIEKYVINEKKQDDDGNDIEDPQLYRAYNDLNEEERDQINKKYIIVHVPPKAPAPGEDEDEEEDDFDQIERSPEYQEARARHEYASKSIHRIILPEIPLIVLIIVHLDMNKNWNWGLTFLPLWISMFFDCCGGCYGFFCTSALAHIEVQEEMAEHFAQQQEAENNEGGESKDDDEDESKNKDEEKGEAKPKEEGADTANGEKSDAAPAAESGKLEKLDVDEKPRIDTAVSVKTEATTQAEPEESEGKSKAKSSDDEDDDEGFEFEMDEDTFHYYQQAEMEAENKATEAQSKAIGSFCNIIFQTLIAALFVVKLNQVYVEKDEPDIDGTSSFSSFWILFPFLLFSGCVICCFACAIFGAANIDTALSSDDAGEGENNEGDGEEEAAATDNGTSPVIVTPPPPPPQGESLAQKKDDETTLLVLNTVEAEVDGEVKLAADTEEESAMDDLD